MDTHTQTLDLKVLAEELEGQLRWSLLHYEVRALETFTHEELTAAFLTDSGPNSMTLGDPASPQLQYAKAGIRVFTGERFGRAPEQHELLVATKEEAIGLVLRHRAADPAAAIARDLAVAQSHREMFERGVENADRWLTDPTHPAYPSAQANAEEYAAKRDEAHATLAAHVAAMAALQAAGLPAAPEPNPEQPSLF